MTLDAIEVPVPASRYDEDYFEHGPIAGVSGYMNYSWMPERTLRMAHHLIANLPIKKGDRVLDFGCAKGFLVKALRILDVEAWGVDVSKYAIAHVDSDMIEFCSLLRRTVNRLDDTSKTFEWMIAKDVFEHLSESELRGLLEGVRSRVRRLFVAVPLGDGERFVIPAMSLDVTHRLAKPLEWWSGAFVRAGWRVDTASFRFLGCKDDWCTRFPEGNAFFTLSRE